MFQPNTDKDWEIFGRTSSYFGVHSEDKFLPENLDESAIREFFASGERQVDEIVQSIRRHVEPDFAPVRCLDFGCGVGRLVFPLARRFRSVIGVDISLAMIEEARRKSQEYGIDNAEFIESDDELSKVSGTFDFILSYIVMQHISPTRGEMFLRGLIGLLDPGGVAALHFTYSFEDWLRSRTPGQRVNYWIRAYLPGIQKFINIVKGRQLNHPNMLMSAYDLNRLFSILQEHGCKDVHAQFTDHGGRWGLMLFFRKVG